MPETKDLFFYDLNGELVDPIGFEFYHAILTTPISNFKRVCGCADGNAAVLLGKNDIGKKYDVEILDPFVIGECEFLGFGTYNFLEVGESVRQHNWVVFKILKTGDLLAVCQLWCDVEPLS